MLSPPGSAWGRPPTTTIGGLQALHSGLSGDRVQAFPVGPNLGHHLRKGPGREVICLCQSKKILQGPASAAPDLVRHHRGMGVECSGQSHPGPRLVIGGPVHEPADHLGQITVQTPQTSKPPTEIQHVHPCHREGAQNHSGPHPPEESCGASAPQNNYPGEHQRQVAQKQHHSDIHRAFPALHEILKVGP